jgi:hypothetical protein
MDISEGLIRRLGGTLEMSGVGTNATNRHVRSTSAFEGKSGPDMLVYQTSTNPFVRAAADVQLVESMHALTYTDPGDAHYDPEAGLYEGLATLGNCASSQAFFPAATGE